MDFADKNILKKNDELVVTIERTGANGEGIAVCFGKVIFIPGAITGEKALIHIVADKGNYLFAKLINVIEKSEDRVDNVCPYFTKCGGCDIQHICYSKQLELKKNIVSGAIEKYAGIKFQVNDTIESDKQLRYRNKFAFPVRNENGKIKIGMFRKNSHDVINFDDCMLQSELAENVVSLFRKYMEENNISAFDEKLGKGTVKHIVLREHLGSFILTVVVTKDFDNFKPLIDILKTKYSDFGIVKNINKLGNNVILGDRSELVFGKKELEFDELGIKYTVSNDSFLQVNDDVKIKIYKKIIELSACFDEIIDAYSGAGLLSSILAKNSKHVTAVEIVKSATENAENLKKINGLDNLTNINGDCAKVIPELAKNMSGDFLAVIDPPRKGVDESVLSAFLKAKPKKIIYLSCNPATLARDISILSESYKLVFVQPYDMFPQTANVETLAVLELVE